MALDPLTAPTLVRRTSDTFLGGYLMMISIIQGVALGIWLNAAVPQILDGVGKFHFVGPAGKLMAGFSSILIVSYQYVWFSTIMRWTPTFFDSLVPYALGVTEIIPGILIGNDFKWWVSMAAFFAVAAGAIFHTILRLNDHMFPDKVDAYRKIRRLLLNLSYSILILMIFSIAMALAVKLADAPAWFRSAAPWIINCMGPVMVLMTERTLMYVYKSYGVVRR